MDFVISSFSIRLFFFLFHVECPTYVHELQQEHSSCGGLPEQSVTNTPRFPGGFVLLRLAQTSSGMTPVKAVSPRNAIPSEKRVIEIYG